MTNCKVVLNGKAKRKGKPTLEFFYCNKPFYYCFGYIDPKTDDPLDECKSCKTFVIYAQEDYDLLNQTKEKYM